MAYAISARPSDAFASLLATLHRVGGLTTMLRLIIFALLALSRTLAQSVPTCLLACATSVCTAGVADLACLCQPTKLESIGACVGTACTGTADVAAATDPSSLFCPGSPCPTTELMPSDDGSANHKYYHSLNHNGSVRNHISIYHLPNHNGSVRTHISKCHPPNHY